MSAFGECSVIHCKAVGFCKSTYATVLFSTNPMYGSSVAFLNKILLSELFIDVSLMLNTCKIKLFEVCIELEKLWIAEFVIAFAV